MKKFKLILVLGYTAFLFGCATGAKMESMVSTDTSSIQSSYDEALKKEVSVTSVSGGEKTNPAWTSEISNENFSGALKASLNKHGLLSDSGKYKLQATLLKVEQPLFGLDMTVTTHVKYTLTNSENNNVIYSDTITTPYTATVGDAFVAVQRLRLANEGAGRNNIEGLLKELSNLKIKQNEITINN